MPLIDKIKDSYFTYTNYYDSIFYFSEQGIKPQEFLKSYSYKLFIKKIKNQNKFYRGLGMIGASNKILLTEFKKIPKILKYLSRGIREEFQKKKTE